MLHDLFNKVIKDSFWIFDLHVDEKGEKVVHLPLIYASNVYAELEAYAKGALHFVKFLEFNTDLQIKIVDDCVFKFKGNQYQSFKLALLEKVSGFTNKSLRIAKLSTQTRTSFASNCIELERRYVFNEQIGNLFEKTYQELVKLISVNLSNQIFETAYLFLNQNISTDGLFQELQQKYLYPPSFSHLKWYAEQTNIRLKNESNHINHSVSHYFWNTVFLRQGVNNSNIASGIEFINQKTASNYDLAYFKDSFRFSDEKFIYDPQGITDKTPSKGISDVEFIFYMLRLLQVNEEYRHYWQARFIRWMKLFFQDDHILKNSSFESLQKIIKEME